MTDDSSFEGTADGIAACHERLIEGMADLGTSIHLGTGAVLFEQGDEAGEIFALLSGRLEVSILSESGRKTVLNVLSENQIFGELSLLDGAARTATVSAIEDSRILRIGRDRLLRAMEDRPSLAIGLLQLVIGRGRWISDQFETLAFEPLEVRLARRLLYLKGVMGDATGRIAVSQHALGDHAGATREAVSKILGGWKTQDMIATHRGGITVLRPDLLALRAEHDLS